MSSAKLKKIFESHGVILAYQFGSTVRGMQSKISDIDIAVLFEKEEPPLRKLLDLSYELSEYFKTDKLDLARLNQASPVLRHVAASEGKLLYEGQKDLDANFSQAALKEYEDTLHLRSVYRNSLRARLAV